MIFVVGNSRSGTTMMGRILTKSIEIYTYPHEFHYFGQIYEPQVGLVSKQEAMNLLAKLIRINRKGYFSKENLSQFHYETETLLSKIETADNLYDPYKIYSFFLNFFTQQNGKNIACDQTPRNLFYLKEIFQKYPDAKVINLVRDPRSVLLSQKNKWKRRFLGAKNIPYNEAIRAWANFHVITISKLWNSSINAYSKYKNNPNLYTVKYEDLLNKPEEIISNLCSFLNVKYMDEMIRIPVVGSSARMDTGTSGIDNSRAKSWQTEDGLTASEIYLCEQITQKNLLEQGYQLSNQQPSKISVAVLYVTLPFKLAFAMSLNLSRNKNIIGSIKRRLSV